MYEVQLSAYAYDTLIDCKTYIIDEARKGPAFKQSRNTHHRAIPTAGTYRTSF